MKTVIISGSSRNDGDTFALVSKLKKFANWDVIDLDDYNFNFYNYRYSNRSDDFLPLIRTVLNDYEVLVFATPVYWYAMSGIMKVFFDRITDVLTVEKTVGRKFRGKKMAVLSTSNGGNLGENFWLPFKATADYLGMDYLGNLHTVAGRINEDELKTFVENIEKEG